MEVTVVDDNDTPPVFLGNLTYVIKENSKIGSLVGYLNATDVDKNTTLRYFLPSAPFQFELTKERKFADRYSLASTAPFAIDTKSGRIATIASPDREQQSKYELVVRADDGKLSTITNATVMVLDEDDNFPFLARSLSSGLYHPLRPPVNELLTK